MDNSDQLPGRHAVEGVAEPGRVASLVDLQTPRHGRRATVEFLIEIIAEPTDRLRQDDARRDRITERRQRNTAPATADPRTHSTQRHRTPDAEAAVPDPERRTQTGAALTEICRPVGQHVIQPATHQPERHRPHGDVVDHAAFAAARRPAPVADHQRRHDARDDAERIRTQRHTADEPDALIRARDVGQRRDRHARTACRTPSASSAVSARTASTPSSSAETNADPTITPSA